VILSAIYIENHFLFEKPQIINFGGKYLFSIDENKKISKEENKSYIPNFYNPDSILLLSAIVGKNGAGKSSLLEIISNALNSQYGFISTIIFEDNDLIYISNKSDIKFNFQNDEIRLNNTINTFYYSPYLDYKSERNGFDLSLDNIIREDLNDIENIRKGNERVEPVQHLKMRTWLRQIEFLNSDIGLEFRELFKLPKNNHHKITFTRYIIDIDKSNDKILFHNTPYGFRDILQFIYTKTRKEADIINKNRPKGFDIIKLQKDLLKNYFLMDFICLFIIQMEKKNNYLTEGSLSVEQNVFIKNHKDKGSVETFFNFLKQHNYKLNNKEFKLLPIEETIELINKVFHFIDNSIAKDERDDRFFSWRDKAIYLKENDAIDLLNLQNDFLNKVNNYYRDNVDSLVDFKFSQQSKITDFINFQPSEINLSSGENSLLNLFSRFHELLVKMNHLQWGNFINIILLDEADLGFHPKWKKQFIKSILFFFDIYFKSLKSKVQIIFTTHDPLTLSDILNYNVVYLDKGNNNIVFDEHLKPKNSFGANISDLLADSFFVGDGLIGEFAKNKIQDVIEYINDENKRTNKNWITSPEVAKKVIEQIGEPYLSEKLNDMFLEAFPEFKDDEIKRLEEKLKQLKK
jgi:predicted ATP-binding protein involved in virulence